MELPRDGPEFDVDKAMAAICKAVAFARAQTALYGTREVWVRSAELAKVKVRNVFREGAGTVPESSAHHTHPPPTLHLQAALTDTENRLNTVSAELAARTRELAETASKLQAKIRATEALDGKLKALERERGARPPPAGGSLSFSQQQPGSGGGGGGGGGGGTRRLSAGSSDMLMGGGWGVGASAPQSPFGGGAFGSGLAPGPNPALRAKTPPVFPPSVPAPPRGKTPPLTGPYQTASGTRLNLTRPITPMGPPIFPAPGKRK